MLTQTLTPQVFRFDNDGYVIHKITGAFKGRVSAWFDNQGNMTDAAHYPQGPRGPERRVVRNGPIWNHAQTIGRRLKPVGP